MHPEMMARIEATWAAHFQLPAETIAEPGTTLLREETRTRESWVSLWPVGQRVVIEVGPALEAEVAQVVAAHPPGHRLTVQDFDAAWGAEQLGHSLLKLYALEADRFMPFVAEARYPARTLTPADQPAFEAFLARCDADEASEADVSIDHEIAFGVFDGERLVAAASVYEWRSFVDIGILTDPGYRGKGFGKAAVSLACAHCLPQARVVQYRHEAVNRASQRIAEGLGFTYYRTIESVRWLT